MDQAYLFANLLRYTEILYTPGNNTLVLRREKSSLISNVTKSSFSGHYEPFSFPASDNETTTEPITFSVFVDGSLLEIFLNYCLAMTSRIYPSKRDALGASLISKEGRATFENVTFWDNMIHVFPGLPVNSSSPLVFGPYYETHVLFPNPFVDEGSQICTGY